ncbi:thermopsin [Sulfolobus acidocaldarius SUSAZ]|nr:thermopsin [Sulfolobus acidocaldarius SUSAZ]
MLTPSVLAYANITSLLAYSNSSENPYGASLQFNVMLQVNTTTSKTYYFWLQNVASFLTNDKVVYFLDNVWNVTKPFTQISNVKGNGQVYTISNGPYGQSFYVYSSGNPISYSYPFSFYMFINTSYTQSLVTIEFGYVIVQNSTVVPPLVKTYDEVQLRMNGVKSAFIVINDSYTPSQVIGNVPYLGMIEDCELVWGGLSNGEKTNFENMSSLLAIYYLSNQEWKSFKNVFDYGFDTAEGANNLNVSLSNQGYALVRVGSENFQLLDANFTPPQPSFTYVTISSKVPLVVNNKLLNNYSSYINSPLVITMFNDFSINRTAIAMLKTNNNTITIYPSSWFKNVTIIPDYQFLYFVTVNSQIPTSAEVNGANTTLTTGLYPADTRVIIQNLTYYESNYARIIILNVTPSLNFTVSSPLNVSVHTKIQYLVTINGVSKWVNNGSKIEVNGNIPFYYSGVYVGTLKLYPGESIIVTEPINESLKLYPNYLNIGTLIGLIFVILILYILIKRK